MQLMTFPHSLRERTLKLRSRAYSATTLLKDYQEFLGGLSYSIGVACYDVKEIRASVIVSRFIFLIGYGIHHVM